MRKTVCSSRGITIVKTMKKVRAREFPNNTITTVITSTLIMLLAQVEMQMGIERLKF
jgi:hypothetical protein